MKWEYAVGAIGLVLFAVGQYLGLVWSPPDAHMGDVARILYVHVPAAAACMFAYTVAFAAALGSLFSTRRGFDAALEAAVETGVMFNALLLLLGSIFARPTWGVWWTWDPRLTSSAVMWLTFIGVMLLRTLIEDADRRAVWSAVATVLAAVNVPVTYFSVQWWRSMHQLQSSPSTMSPEMFRTLMVNLAAFTLVMTAFIAQRYRIARARALKAAPPPLPPVEPAEAR